MAKAKIPTTQDLEALADKALYDPQARAELEDISARLANRANSRMKELEKKGLKGTSAYNNAKYFLQNQDFGNGKTFSRSKKLDDDELFLNAKNAANFLRSQTSTARGEMERRKSIIDSLADHGVIDVPEDDVTEWKKQFLQFLDDDVWKDIKKNIYTPDILNQAGEALKSGASLSSLTQSFKDYQRGKTDTDLFEIWDEWTSGKKYYKGGEWRTYKRYQ